MVKMDLNTFKQEVMATMGNAVTAWYNEVSLNKYPKSG